jgi:hypothetical protein
MISKNSTLSVADSPPSIIVFKNHHENLTYDELFEKVLEDSLERRKHCNMDVKLKSGKSPGPGHVPAGGRTKRSEIRNLCLALGRMSSNVEGISRNTE